MEHSTNWTISKSLGGRSGARASSNIWRWTDATQTVAEFAVDPHGKGTPDMLVDASDMEVVLQLTWQTSPTTCTELFYAAACIPVKLRKTEPFATLCRRDIKRPHQIFMHMLFNPSWKMTDHVNGNGLDNRRVNLVESNWVENAMNRRIHGNNTSGANGVYLIKQPKTNSWFTYVTVNKKRISKCFSFGAYSHRNKDDAYELAVAWRKARNEAIGCTNGTRPKAV